MRERIERLRKLTHDAPSPTTWAALRDALESGPSALLRYVAPHLETWPDALLSYEGRPTPLPTWWPLVRKLSLRGVGYERPHRVQEALSGGTADHVTELDLSLCSLRDPEHVVGSLALLGPSVERLDLSSNPLSAEAVSEASRAEVAFGLRTFRAGNCGLGTGEVTRLLSWEALDGVRTVGLEGNRLGGSGVRRVGSARVLRRLEDLDLAQTGLRDADLEPLCEGRATRGLRRLSLARCSVQGPGLEAVARSAGGTLAQLDLSYCPVRHPEHLQGYDALERLNLSSCGLDKPLAEGLAGCVLPSLRHLDLSDNPLRDGGALALGRGPVVAMLRSVDLTSCALRGLRLPELLRHSALEHLALADNTLRSAAIRHLTAWPGFSGLRTLDLTQNFLRDEDARLLAEALGGSSEMSSFAVSSDFLRDPGALAILRAHRTAELESLTLGGRFSPAVLAAVVELGGRNLAQLHIDVEVVEVDHNWDAAVLALARSTRFPALRRAQVPPISLSAGVALTRAPRAMATAVLLGSSGPWLRALAAELEVKLPPRASIPMAVARLVAH